MKTVAFKRFSKPKLISSDVEWDVRRMSDLHLGVMMLYTDFIMEKVVRIIVYPK